MNENETDNVVQSTVWECKLLFEKDVFIGIKVALLSEEGDRLSETFVPGLLREMARISFHYNPDTIVFKNSSIGMIEFILPSEHSFMVRNWFVDESGNCAYVSDTMPKSFSLTNSNGKKWDQEVILSAL